LNQLTFYERDGEVVNHRILYQNPAGYLEYKGISSAFAPLSGVF
jgi:hypothetical protein